MVITVDRISADQCTFYTAQLRVELSPFLELFLALRQSTTNTAKLTGFASVNE